MPNEKGTMSEVKPGSRRPHPQSQWFSLEELAPFTKEVLRVECPLQGREKSPKGARQEEPVSLLSADRATLSGCFRARVLIRS
jgi:hypothetical protein